MSWIRYDENEQGTPVSVHRCETCGDEFTVCPARSPVEIWDNCLSEECASYDESRDADRLFDRGSEKIRRHAVH